MALLLYQHVFLEKIINYMREGGQYILIEGKSGSGKSYTMKQLQIDLTKENYHVIIFDGDYQYDDREYYPFKKSLFSDQDSSKDIIVGGIAETSKGIPGVGNLVSYIINTWSERKNTVKNMVLNSEEQNILAKLRHISKKKI